METRTTGPVLSALKKIVRSEAVANIGGRLIAQWLRLVYATNPMVTDLNQSYDEVDEHFPAIFALWHGQHFMTPFMRREGHTVRAMISRSLDGQINSVAAQSLGLEVVRGSGGRNRAKTKAKGGIPALKNLIATLANGESVAMTVNVPKTGARECGLGVVTLAKLSGRPIIPIAYASSRRVDLDTWDRASINLPFGKASFMVGEPIFVDREAEDEALDEARRKVEVGLNHVTDKAYRSLS